jgi:hypothetical protein
VIVPRIGALALLIGSGFALATVGRLLMVTAGEGYGSWTPALLFLLPTATLGLLSGVLVLAGRPLGVSLAYPLCMLLAATAIVLFFELPPLDAFLRDYERAALERGVRVPDYLAEGGTTTAEYVADEVRGIRRQGALGAIAVVGLYAATVLRGGRPRPKTAGGT